MSFLFYEKGLELALGVNQAVKAKISDKKRSCGAFLSASRSGATRKKSLLLRPKIPSDKVRRYFFYEFGPEPFFILIISFKKIYK